MSDFSLLVFDRVRKKGNRVRPVPCNHHASRNEFGILFGNHPILVPKCRVKSPSRTHTRFCSFPKKSCNCSGHPPAFSVPSRMSRGLCFFVIALLMVSAFCGCVRRKMTVHTNPPGANVSLDGREIGRTPFTTNFKHYGKQEFRIVKPGYETKTELVPVRAPWYQWVGFDFVSEVLLPGKLTDHKYYEFDLQPERIVPPSDIVTRAEQFRQTAHADGMPRIGSTAVTPSLSPTPPSRFISQ